MCLESKGPGGPEMVFGFYSDQDREPMEGFIKRSDMIWVGLKRITDNSVENRL